jgi:hypothetical protein
LHYNTQPLECAYLVFRISLKASCGSRVHRIGRTLGITDTALAMPYRCPILRDTGYGGDTHGGAVDPIVGHGLHGRHHTRLGLQWLQLSGSLVTSPAASSAYCWLPKPKLSSFYFTVSSVFLLLV